MDYLPSSDEQRFLIRSLHELIERRGVEPFVAAPLLEPTAEFFPDTWAPSARGVKIVLLRLLSYAGLQGLRAHVELFAQPTLARDELWGSSFRHRGAAAWFAGIEDGTCRFGVDARKLTAPEALVGVLCHEVAHAYRQHHGLVGEDRDVEEQLTDLTTIYLGFGVLTVNNTDRHRASGSRDLRTVTHESHGYLSPQAMSFLLAAQVLGRRAKAREQRRIAQLLEPNQAAFYEAACEHLGGDLDKLARRLGLPPAETWPKPRPLTEILRPIEHEPEADVDSERGEVDGERGEVDGERGDDEEDQGRAPPSAPEQRDEAEPETRAEELSEVDAHIARLRSDPKIARALAARDDLALLRALRARKTSARSPAEEEAIAWIAHDPRRRMDRRKNRPILGMRFGCGTELSGAYYHDRSDRSHVATLMLKLFGAPLAPLAAYVVCPEEGRVEIQGRVPLTTLHGAWRGAFAVAALTLLALPLWSYLANRRGDVYFVNGLDVPVAISVGEEQVKVEPQSWSARTLARGTYRAIARGPGNAPIEEQEIAVPGGDTVVAYNVLGAAAIDAYEAVYDTAPGRAVNPASESYLGERVIERADVSYTFNSPPRELRASGGPQRHWVLALNPGGWHASYRALTREGRASEAAALAAAVSLIEPEDEAAVAQSTWAAMANGGGDAALSHLGRLLERAPGSVAAHEEKQSVLMYLGRDEECRALYRRMHDDAPGSTLAAYLRARVEPSNERLRLLPDLLSKHPEDARLHHLHGMALVAAGRHAEALPALTRASAPGALRRGQALHALAHAYVALGRTDDALARVAAAADAAPDAGLAVLYGRLARLSGDARKPYPADHYFDKIAGDIPSPEDRVLYRLAVGDLARARAELAGTQERRSRALVELYEALASSPERTAASAAAVQLEVLAEVSVAVRVLVATALARKGDTEAAGRAIGGLQPNDSDAAAAAAYMLGRSRDPDIGALEPEVQAALCFADAHHRGLTGAELEEARRAALALDVLRGPVTRAIEGWPR
ncbi:hypothetical protein [Sorangium sp. So ce1097]|uniref:hypothetical protein n=1 Tax=Sorangium sp. So ce1097 TaxID=3133330 RepID=UPI003F625894